MIDCWQGTRASSPIVSSQGESLMAQWKKGEYQLSTPFPFPICIPPPFHPLVCTPLHGPYSRQPGFLGRGRGWTVGRSKTKSWLKVLLLLDCGEVMDNRVRNDVGLKGKLIGNQCRRLGGCGGRVGSHFSARDTALLAQNIGNGSTQRQVLALFFCIS